MQSGVSAACVGAGRKRWAASVYQKRSAARGLSPPKPTRGNAVAVTRYEVFLSSTGDLDPERAAANEILEDEYGEFLEPYDYKKAYPHDPPLRVLREKLATVDAFLSTLGARYGDVPPTGTDGRSMVEWEYDTASGRLWPARPPIIVAIKKDVELEPPQAKFVARISDADTGKWVHFYTALSEYELHLRRAFNAAQARIHKQEVAETALYFPALTAVIIVGAFALLTWDLGRWTHAAVFACVGGAAAALIRQIVRL